MNQDLISTFYSQHENYTHEILLKWREGHIYTLFLEEYKGLLYNKRVLHIGCNSGTTTCLINKRIGKKGILHACDINPEALHHAKKLNKGTNIIFTHCSVHDMPYDTDYFDTIILWDVYEHWRPKDLPLFNKELHRVLKPKGTLLVFVPRAVKGNPSAFDSQHKGFYKDGEELLNSSDSFFKGVCKHEVRCNPGRLDERHDGLFAVLNPIHKI